MYKIFVCVTFVVALLSWRNYLPFAVSGSFVPSLLPVLRSWEWARPPEDR